MSLDEKTIKETLWKSERVMPFANGQRQKRFVGKYEL